MGLFTSDILPDDSEIISVNISTVKLAYLSGFLDVLEHNLDELVQIGPTRVSNWDAWASWDSILANHVRDVVINELWRNVWRRLKNNEGDAVRWAP
jgi:hypothetical protein